MNRSIVLLWLLVAIASMSMIARSTLRWGSARHVADERRAALDQLRIQSGTLQTLQVALPSWVTRAPVDATLLTSRVSDALAASNIPPARLIALSPESDVTLSGAGAVQTKRRRATLTLAPISLPELGRFVDRWAQREPGWTIAALDLIPQAAKDENRVDQQQHTLRVVLTLESTFLHEAGGTP